MPKDMLDALIERLEMEGDQYDHAWDEALRIFDALPLEERTQARRQELETSTGRCIRPVHCSCVRSPWRSPCF